MRVRPPAPQSRAFFYAPLESGGCGTLMPRITRTKQIGFMR